MPSERSSRSRKGRTACTPSACVARLAGRPLACPRCCPARGRRGSRVRARPKAAALARCEAGLEAGGAAPYDARRT